MASNAVTEKLKCRLSELLANVKPHRFSKKEKEKICTRAKALTIEKCSDLHWGYRHATK